MDCTTLLLHFCPLHRYVSARLVRHEIANIQINSGDLSVLHRALDRLLRDDDEALRNGAAEIVRRGLGMSSSVCRDRADELWCDWVATHVAELSSEDAGPWTEWIRDMADEGSTHDVPKSGGESITQSSPSISPSRPGGTTLFTIEPANLFRDPEVDAQRARNILEAIERRKS